MRKGTFFRDEQCAALSSFRVGKMLFYRKRVCFYKFYIRLQKQESRRTLERVTFLTAHSEKGYQFQNVEHKLFSVSFAVLCSRIHRVLTPSLCE